MQTDEVSTNLRDKRGLHNFQTTLSPPPMKTNSPLKLAVLTGLLVLSGTSAFAQRGATSNPDHAEMLTRLGITQPLRPGPAGSDVNAANYANYDESKATAKSPVPDLLTMGDGKTKITTPAMWEQRRKELFEIFDREFYGRLPEAAKTIKVTWEVTGTTQGMSGNIPTITRQLVGHVDNSSYPAITVNIGASVTTPANAAGKVPVKAGLNLITAPSPELPSTSHFSIVDAEGNAVIGRIGEAIVKAWR